MRLATWNVLHRIHAENWREEVPDRFPSEADRIAVITRRLAALFEEPGEALVVCLQEVSGDQLESLRVALPGVRVHSFVYPRIPSLKSGAPSPLRRPEEHLVTLAPGGRLRHAQAFAADPGKGLLAVEVEGVVVVNTHVSFGDRRAPQLELIAQTAGDAHAVVCGDFNAGAAQVLAGLGPGFALVDLGPDALPTRPRRDPRQGKPPAIDHLVARGLATHGGRVVDVAGESDHNLVRATLEAR